MIQFPIPAKTILLRHAINETGGKYLSKSTIIRRFGRKWSYVMESLEAAVMVEADLSHCDKLGTKKDLF